MHHSNKPKFSLLPPPRRAEKALGTVSVQAKTTIPFSKASYSNIWNSLTSDEAAAVIDYIHRQRSHNVTAVAKPCQGLG
jgi:hypothetical protein